MSLKPAVAERSTLWWAVSFAGLWSSAYMSARIETRWSGPIVAWSWPIAIRAATRAFSLALWWPAWLWAKRLSTCRKEARTTTISTSDAMTVSERTSEKPERWGFMGKLG